MLLGALSSGDGLPFWATSNRYGLMPDNGFALAVVDARRPYEIRRDSFVAQRAPWNDGCDAGIGNGAEAALRQGFEWQCGVSLAAALEGKDGGVKAMPVLDELYGGIRWKPLRFDAGMMHRSREFLGADPLLGSLSSTEGHVVESNNARTMPGFRFSLEPWYVPYTRKHLSVSGVWGDYLTTDSRYMQDALVHRLRAYLRYDIVPGLYVQAGIDHYALWGGSNPEKGSMPVTFANYFRIATGRSGVAGSSNLIDQQNTLGDHGGAEQLRIGWEREGRSITFQWEKPYADKSGMRMDNFPDGIYTLHYSLAGKDCWLSDILLEAHYTMWQSGTVQQKETDDEGNLLPYEEWSKLNVVGGDDYFNNREYKSGWTHYRRGICAPLFFTGPYLEGIPGFENNRYKALHLGLGGKFFRKSPYRLMLTAGEYYGTYRQPYLPPSSLRSGWNWWEKNTIDKGLFQFSAGLDGSVKLKAGRLPFAMSVIYGLYADFGKLLQHNVAATAGIRINL